MILFKKTPLATESTQIEFKEKESLQALRKRVVGQHEKAYCVVYNGKKIEEDFLGTITVDKTDNVLIAADFKGGTFREMMRTLAVVAVVAGVSVATAGWGLVAANGFWMGVAGSAITMGAAVLASSIMFALLPPLQPQAKAGASYKDSQMYTLDAQQNAINKNGIVPKVYGTHRMYPAIAATPYTEIDVDDNTDEQVQYFYCIYDFGLGPVEVTDIKIGDTSLGDYTNLEYNLVDLNRPKEDEGPWDEQLKSNFTLYKADNIQKQIGVTLDKNESSAHDPSRYQVIRNTAVSDGTPLRIKLDFSFPRGLASYNTSGDRGGVAVGLDIRLREVGTKDWIPYNDKRYFEVVKTSDKITTYDEALTVDTSWHYEYIGRRRRSRKQMISNNPELVIISSYDGEREYYDVDSYWRNTIYYRNNVYGFPKGTKIITTTRGFSDSRVNRELFIGGHNLGTVKIVNKNGKLAYELDKPLEFAVPLFTLACEHESYEDFRDPDGNWYYDSIYNDELINYAEAYTKYQNAGELVVDRNNANPVYGSMIINAIKSAQYEVKLTRKYTHAKYDYQIQDIMQVATITTSFDRAPITTKKRHTFLELKIKATNQLSGTISDLNGIASSILDVYNEETGTWHKEKTSNPAWIFADLLTGEVNKRATTKDKLDLDTLVDWAKYCDEIPKITIGDDLNSDSSPRYRINFVLDFDTTLQNVLNLVANQCQASLNIIDSRYGVLIDKKKSVPVQLFTPRNYSNFNAEKKYEKMLTAVKVNYIDPMKWGTNQVVAYLDGYDERSENEVDEVNAFGCTDREQAWRYGRYMLAQALYRQQTITIDVDFEYLLCNRGDYVMLTSDVMMQGGTPARVISVNPETNEVEIDEKINIDHSKQYGYVVRTVDGIERGKLTFVATNKFIAEGVLPSYEDLIVVGIATQETRDFIVKAIAPSDDLKATLTLVEKHDEIFDYESGRISIPLPPVFNADVGSADYAPPSPLTIEVVKEEWECKGAGYEYYLDVEWLMPPGAVVEVYNVYVNTGKGYNLVGTSKNTKYRYAVNSNDLNVLHEFKVIAVSARGNKVSLGEVPSASYTPEAKTTPPSDVENISLNVTNEALQIQWKQVPDCDIAQYLVRFSVQKNASWENSIPLLKADRKTTNATVQARTGTYLIKAIDFMGNESKNAARAVTAIPDLVNLNIIEETTDFPELPGALVRAEKLQTAIVLQKKTDQGLDNIQYYSDGYYYYKKLLDLGEIFTVRLQSKVQANGYTEADLMKNWKRLSDVKALTTSGFSDWDVKVQYRSTTAFNTMSEWPSLSAVTALNIGAPDQWTDWRDFIMTDATGRIFQFRLKLISNKASITPRVYDGVIRADMADRLASGNNLLAPIEGLQVVYDAPFKGPANSPVVAVTIDNAEQGDTYVISDKNLANFNIKFYDKDGNAVERQFDYLAKGYGKQSSAVI